MTTDMHAPIAQERGFMLVELIMYTVILSVVVGALTLTGVSLLRTFVQMQVREDIANASMTSLERIVRELRFAEGVNIGASTLGVSPGVLALNSLDAAGNATTITFALSGGRITVRQNAGAASPLTPASVTVTNLVFTRVTSGESEAVRTTMTIEATIRGTTVSRDFRTFTVLDAS